MSSMCSEIKFEGYDSSPIFTTPVVEIAGYGMGPAKMGWKGEPLAGTDKLQVPVIPTTEMSEALEEITVQIAKRVQENLVKVRISAPRMPCSPCYKAYHFAPPVHTTLPCSGNIQPAPVQRRR